MSLDVPIVPAIRVKDSPRPRRLDSLQDALSFVDDARRARRAAPWREIERRLKDAQTEEDAFEAIGALRELLMIEGLLEPASRKHP
ncbi:MAG: hypothetical protein HY852_22455 [Bradyrhizobium sp.]|uniref:hypothetical protein n=1 Tax=Bradyrhizobium sp. TaxID=376 RepID=UPI0025C4E9C8|nr:hypothetical protein [Bradyrhizobium sp.]MBI5264566.1 hypothetical protein [Bradyrhizobium sp.]